ncbi:hypothetical protein PVAP13_3NG005300 [Panicum virgatum]|uniref:Uncharacterized protein n=1 Tax=Panicum virgatum TaxID=38727 RepID=A0A8T0TRS6_PANVG|nr:hypothetical protein PVAP13_3NG005300 [Panicum virgatum]
MWRPRQHPTPMTSHCPTTAAALPQVRFTASPPPPLSEPPPPVWQCLQLEMRFLDAMETYACHNLVPSSSRRRTLDARHRLVQLPARQELAQATGGRRRASPRVQVVVVERRPSHLGRNDGGTTQLRIFSPTARGGPSLAPSWYPEAGSSELQGRRSVGRLSGQRKRRAR